MRAFRGNPEASHRFIEIAGEVLTKNGTAYIRHVRGYSEDAHDVSEKCEIAGCFDEEMTRPSRAESFPKPRRSNIATDSA